MSRDRVYCGDHWCDGDHISYTERCEAPTGPSALDGSLEIDPPYDYGDGYP